MESYVLLKDFNWFGKTIPSGTIYKQYKSTKDKFRCFDANGNECPHWDLTFMTVRANPEWFMQLNERAVSAAFS
jgi:hypothetical protein